MIKKILAFVLAFASIAAVLPICSFAESATLPSLYTFYSDGMLFKQNETAVIAGTAKRGSEISCELYDSSGALVARGETSAENDETFAVSFAAPSGGYDEYYIVLKAAKAEFARLENVVFGEQWLASGQSNMQYPLSQAKGGSEMFAEEKKLDKWLRVLLVPDIPEYKGSKELVPVDPQNDIPGAVWVSGEDAEIYSMSAVAYYFAKNLREELDMPVGILNIPLGGTSIDVWLSRKAIDSDPEFKEILVSQGKYIEKSDWNESKVNVYKGMTTNYNLKVEALRHFGLSGMIWYQGESNIQLNEPPERYAKAFDLMQRSYTELFGYENGLLPIIYTHLAAYYYSEDGYELTEMNAMFSDMQKQRPESRAVVSVSDIPLTYLQQVGDIHPECKEEIGERMAFAAEGLVYGKRETYTAATPKKVEIKNDGIYVTFENTGDGLALKGDRLTGFAVCASDGVYVAANAEIIDKNTVKISDGEVEDPCGASYAYCVDNQRANLYSVCDRELIMPVSPFVTDKTLKTHFFADKVWTDCEDEVVWHSEKSKYSGYFNAWNADDAKISFEAQSAFGGSAGLNVVSESESFSINPILQYKKDGINQTFYDADKDYSDYGKISIYVRNNGKSEVSLDTVRFYKNSLVWYAPAVSGGESVRASISADGQWHCVSFSLDDLYLFGNECGFTYPNERLDSVKNIKFCFSSSDESNIDVDEIRFAPLKTNEGIRFNANVRNAKNIFEFVSAAAVTVIGFFAKLFN